MWINLEFEPEVLNTQQGFKKEITCDVRNQRWGSSGVGRELKWTRKYVTLMKRESKVESDTYIVRVNI